MSRVRDGAERRHMLTDSRAQTGGISPYPALFRENGAEPMFNIYGDGVHMIGYPVNDHDISWA